VNLSFETMLVLGVTGFYLYDSAMMLYSNELVFTAGKQWHFASAESHWQLLGKNLYLPNPLTPGRALFRVCWFITDSSKPQQDLHVLSNFLDSLRPLRGMTYGLFALMFIGLPVMIFGFGSGLELLIIVAATYLTIVAMLLYVLIQRTALRLSKKAISKLAFESLACAPFALNLLRKISLQHSLAGDPIVFAQKNFDADTFKHLTQVITQRIDTEIVCEDDSTPRYTSLLSYRSKILGMAP
jgi:hypothetical protein